MKTGSGGAIVLSTILAVACFAASAAPVSAAEANVLRLVGLRPLPDSVLDRLRGGFTVGPFHFAIGVTVSTAVNDALVLRTSFNVAGPNDFRNLRSTVVGPVGPVGPTGPVGPQDPVGPQGIPGPQGTPGLQIGTGPVGTAESGPASPLPAAGGARGAGSTGPAMPGGTGPAPTTTVQAAGEGGFTVGSIPNGIQVTSSATRIIQQIGDGVLTQIVNSANGQSISHSTTIDLIATNFAQIVGATAVRLQFNNLAFESARLGLMSGH